MNDYFNILDEMFKDFEEYKDIQKGKGIRGKLITIINPKAQKLAAIVEGIHLASLLHDDIIDEADTRRGVESINAKYGDFTALMLGDIIYSRSFFELIEYGEEVAKIISNAVYLLSQGELEDMKLSKNINLDEKRYFSMIYKKTASLIEASCKAAAITRGFDKDKFALYGKNLGIAFQIVDDLLDIFGDEKIVGKPLMMDFYEGKTTLPYIYLYNVIDDKKKLLSFYKKDLNQQEKEWIKNKMVEYDIFKKVFDIANELINEAKFVIKEYNIKDLENIADMVIKRKF